MNRVWYDNYNSTSRDFRALFDSEQEYVDAVFILLIWQNFGMLLRPEQLHRASLHI